MNKEIWKDIPKYENYYQVSNLGRVKSLDREMVGKSGKKYIKKGLIMTPGLKHSSLSVILSKDGKRENNKVHKLVMLAFVGERPNGMQICHKDGDFKNNNLNNLRYDTAKENKKDCYRYSEKPKNAKLSIDDVLTIRRMHNKEGYTQKEISIIFNVSRPHISHIISGRSFSWIDEYGNII